ncbi:MAG: glycosyltransferase family 4 protein [Anaerolineae bacterium]|nr:glycosyltransferase family 4 protein [Anaerolineae bacterium]
MHIVLGAYLLSGTPGYRQAGVHQYARQLLHHLANGDRPEGLRFTALVSPTATAEAPRARDPLFAVRTASRTTELPLSRIVVEQTETPHTLRALQADLYHGLGFVAPLRAPCPTVVTVFDLSFITQPGAHRLLNRTYLSLFARWSCRRAARVIAISEWTKRDLTHHFGVAPERIDVTPLGVDHHRFKPMPPDEIATFRAKHGLGNNAIFYLGSLEPRKNLPRLINAFAQLHAQHPGLDAVLVIGGNLAWKYDAILTHIRQLGLGERIRLIGRVSEEDLPKWYSACAVMTYPSLYEGFGLPPLEAMACGAPVVTSNVTALPEVIGDAGIAVDPTDAHALAEALRRVLSDAPLRAEMRARSLARAARFTWERTAALTLESYRRAAS